MQRITVLHVVLIVAFIQCAYLKWQSLLHFAHTISNPYIIADVPVANFLQCIKVRKALNMHLLLPIYLESVNNF